MIDVDVSGNTATRNPRANRVLVDHERNAGGSEVEIGRPAALDFAGSFGHSCGCPSGFSS